MRYLKYTALILFTASLAQANDLTDIRELANANGFSPSNKVLKAVIKASKRYNVDPKELAAIGILETGLGKYLKDRVNDNGTTDEGVFQINTVNQTNCKSYDLKTVEGSAYCAAKLLHKIAKNHTDYLGRYHSKTPKHKKRYENALMKVLKIQLTESE